MKKLMITLMVLAGLLSFAKAADAADSAPSTVIHVVTVAWKEGTTADQIEKALNSAKALPSKFPGITRVWTKSLKVQGDKKNAIVMEFASEQALKEYGGSDAQKEWYKDYLPIRASSTTFDITN